MKACLLGKKAGSGDSLDLTQVNYWADLLSFFVPLSLIYLYLPTIQHYYA